MKASEEDKKVPNLLAFYKKQKDKEQPEHLDDLDAETVAASGKPQRASALESPSRPPPIDFSSMTKEDIEAMLAWPRNRPC